MSHRLTNVAVTGVDSKQHNSYARSRSSYSSQIKSRCIQQVASSVTTTSKAGHARRHLRRRSRSPSLPQPHHDGSLPETAQPVQDEFDSITHVPLTDPPTPACSTGPPIRSTGAVRYPRVWIEEVADEGDFPIHSRVTDIHPTAGRPLPGIFRASWECRWEKELKEQSPPWSCFASADEWDFAKFLMKSGLSQQKVDELLHLQMVTDRLQPSFSNKYEFFKKVDTLPKGPRFSCETVTITGDILDAQGRRMKEEAELWLRDPVECVRELMGRVSLQSSMAYCPTRVYTGEDRKTRIFEEMWSADWWWEIQDKLPEGATVAPVILASDKTQLSTFGGDKSAYPVYLTLGNIAKNVRRQPSQRATILLGYLPVPTLSCCSTTTRQLKGYEVFHACMARLLQPMIKAGKNGVSILCCDGRKRRVFPLLAAYCADHPEQCQVACCPENRCPKGTIGRDDRGELGVCWGRDVEATLLAMRKVHSACTATEKREALDELKADGIRAVLHPFWADLPHCDIFLSLMPDILHQLHKGVFHAHLVKWCDQLMAPGELDRRFIAMASHPDLRHFSKGITTVKQWTGKEQRAMEKVFVGAVAGGVNDPRVVVAARAMLDFIYLAQLPAHTSHTLTQMDECLLEFHRNKAVFAENGIRSNFNIPKLHSLVHYTDSITSYGAADGYNTEYPERFHIEYAKLGYRASNKRDYEKQMVTWLERQEAVDAFDSYIRWACPETTSDEVPSDNILDEDEGDGLEEPRADDTLPVAAHRRTTFRIAKKPPLTSISLAVIREHFGVRDLVTSLNAYMHKLAATTELRGLRFHPVSSHESFNLFKRATLLVPPPFHGFSLLWEDRVRAIPAKVPRVLSKLGSRSAFDTVLVKTPPRSAYRYRVARLRLIFELPVSVAEITPQPTLAYVEWFTELKATRHPTRMFEVSKLLGRDKMPVGEVIPLSQVMRSCHLIPRWEDDLTAPVDAVLDAYWNPDVDLGSIRFATSSDFVTSPGEQAEDSY
ncbi:hypothetical protein M407DRAFT_12650 [Tulasnella calospora MUT 4182]|uniref:Uncharacterized protein n=1 Tax=Tulasnella calospora MUT 4182 TaxID=1051891 RepID=A0A0C3Q2T2_9AGAM|nr:hypothetical protein M407DRAFT_12650 [Tulasnella calospora MUT 4182]